LLSTGLGILAGDYCKEASDLGLPMVAVGFMYPQGYFHQHINIDGWQEEIFEQLNFEEAPITRVLDKDDKPLVIAVPVDDHSIHLAVWEVLIGRVKLFLLDTNVEKNTDEDRVLSARLYVSERETRLKQELVIGIGGVRVLRALGIHPCTWHANEGHTSFMMLERARELVEQGMSFEEAVEKIRLTSVFTTHTSVPAGTDVFPVELVEKYMKSYWPQLKITREEFLELGSPKTGEPTFNMSMLSLNMSSQRNAVSQLHNHVCCRIWHYLWPDVPENKVPITYITNGVHVPTWVSQQNNNLYRDFIDEDWQKKQDDPAMWQKINSVPNKEIWEIRRWLKYKLMRAIKDRLRIRLAETKLDPSQMLALGSLLDTEILTIGFCRRATEYKRASLIFNDMDRLKKILNNRRYPVQIIFAGKAHPNDVTGKYIIQEIYRIAKDPQFEGRIAFVENYDMHMARFLVQGVDVWLNTPRWLEEASGTSGMKSCINGGLQLSVLDGWWNEAYNKYNGWAVDRDEVFSDPVQQNNADSEQIYNILENKVVPLFYERDINGIPNGWIDMIKESIRSIVPVFNTERMLKEYTRELYLNTTDFCIVNHRNILK